jgi:hypothetical protein
MNIVRILGLVLKNLYIIVKIALYFCEKCLTSGQDLGVGGASDAT